MITKDSSNMRTMLRTQIAHLHKKDNVAQAMGDCIKMMIMLPKPRFHQMMIALSKSVGDSFKKGSSCRRVATKKLRDFTTT